MPSRNIEKYKKVARAQLEELTDKLQSVKNDVQVKINEAYLEGSNATLEPAFKAGWFACIEKLKQLIRERDGMQTVVFTYEHVSHYVRETHKPITSITLEDISTEYKSIVETASIIVFVDGQRSKVLKNRYNERQRSK